MPSPNDLELIHGITFRPKIYINLGYTKGTVTRADIKNNTVSTKLTGFTPVGAVQSLEIDSTRNLDVWRELDYTTAGKPVESFPGLVSYTVSMERIVLYESTFLEAFGFDSFDILRQNTPLTLEVKMSDPEEKYDKTWYVYGVWFKSNPMKFDIRDVDDLRILQKVDGIAAGIIAAAK